MSGGGSMVLLLRAKEGGCIAPSFLKEENSSDDDGFVKEMLALLAGDSGFSLSSDPNVPVVFSSLLKKASSSESVPGSDENHKKSVLELRRALILGLVAGTDDSNPSVERILESTYLSELKNWLDDVLNGTIGGIDFLLHFLKNISDLPVTSAMVKQSGLGKLVGSIEKHQICSGPNEGNIRERIDVVKASWKARVKARKATSDAASSKPPVAPKREASASSASASPPTAKRVKVTDASPKSTLSSLLQKVSGTTATGANGVKEESAKAKWEASNSASQAVVAKKKKPSVRVKWADHFGGELKDARLIEGENVVQVTGGKSESWNDQKKRDREKEKKLLLTMKKAKLLDDDDEDENEPVPAAMQATVPWRVPALLPENPDIPKTQLNSSEVSSQTERQKTAAAARYFSENTVPPNPTPLSDVEQALDMTAQASSNVANIPFFAAPPPAAAAASAVSTNAAVNQSHTDFSVSTLPTGGATPEFVQALGLPLFLVGQNTQALQTLAASPGLLNSLVDASGMYDQTRLLSLVQTLSGTPAPAAAPPAHQFPPPASTVPYGSAGGYSSYAGTSSYAVPRTRSDEGNLHVSGYGPMTTQADLIAVFSPYVVVDEVVMKGTFAFVNTSDPVNAQRAREALTGTLVGGQPIRINAAQRKSRDSNTPRSGLSAYGNSPYGNAAAAQPGGAFSFNAQAGGYQNQPPPPPPQPSSIEDIRDSRGNAPTKNLFVAGYGPGTSEVQIRQIFSQHCNVVGVVLKGNFTFVNTGSKEDAVKAREMLQGNMINGGPLRINFAKETGRLGTSFDLTYNQSSGPNARRQNVPPASSGSYYGR